MEHWAKGEEQGAEDGIVERLSESLLTGYSDEGRKGEGAKGRKGDCEMGRLSDYVSGRQCGRK